MAAALIREDDRFDYGETRYIALGEIDDALCLVFTFRGSRVRAISLRKANKEIGRYGRQTKINPELHDGNPEWTERDFAKAKPASEVLPPEVMAQFRNKGGRPRIENPKEAVMLRIDADVLAKFRQSGPGRQTRINGI